MWTDKVMSDRRRKKRIRRPHKGTIVILCLLILSGLFVFFLPQFYISQIRVSGQRVLTKEDIMIKTHIRTGEHILSGVSGSLADIFSLRHPDKEKLIKETFPYVKEVTVRSEFPSVLSVILEERIEVAYISIQDGFLIIDADGVALEVMNRTMTPAVPVIEGLIVRSIDLGSVAEVDKQDYLKQTAVVLTCVFNADMDTRAEIRLLDTITAIRPVGENTAYMKLTLPDEGGILNVKVAASDDICEDMLWLRFALSQRKLNGLGEGILDLTTSQRVFVPAD